MRTSFKVLALAGLGLVGIWGSSHTIPADAQEAEKIQKSAYGGLMARTGHHRFEVFFYPTGVRVFPKDASGKAIDASKLAAIATFYHPNSPDPWFTRPLRGTSESLDLAIGLQAAPRTGARVAFDISGLPGSDESAAAFTLPLEFVESATPRPTAPIAAAAASPRYVYAPGYRGYGYYAYPGPETPPRAVAAAPTYYGGYATGEHYVGPMHRDWSTGRDLPLAKPWLSPRD